MWAKYHSNRSYIYGKKGQINSSLKSSEDGFTLVEILVTIVVAAILIGSLSIIVNNNAILAKRGRSLTVVNAYAENKVEEIRSKGYLSLEDGVTDISNEIPTDLANPKSGSMTVVNESPGLKLVEISVSYNDQGKTATQTYKTFVGELGVGQY